MGEAKKTMWPATRQTEIDRVVTDREARLIIAGRMPTGNCGYSRKKKKGGRGGGEVQQGVAEQMGSANALACDGLYE